jgi:hypothetical protein
MLLANCARTPAKPAKMNQIIAPPVKPPTCEKTILRVQINVHAWKAIMMMVLILIALLAILPVKRAVQARTIVSLVEMWLSDSYRKPNPALANSPFTKQRKQMVSLTLFVQRVHINVWSALTRLRLALNALT